MAYSYYPSTSPGLRMILTLKHKRVLHQSSKWVISVKDATHLDIYELSEQWITQELANASYRARLTNMVASGYWKVINTETSPFLVSATLEWQANFSLLFRPEEGKIE